MICEDCGESRAKLCNGDMHLCKKCKLARFPTTPPNRTKMASSNSINGDDNNGDSTGSQSKLDQIQATLQTLTTKMDKINGLEEKLEDMRACVEYVSNFFDGFNEQLKELRSDNNDLREKLAKSENEINELQQYTRRNNLEISGVIEEDEENTDDIVVKVAVAAGVTIT